MQSSDASHVEIYALSCPDTGDVRYIGKANNAMKRFDSHMREKRRKYPVYMWRDKLLSQGKRPIMTVIATSIGDWRQLEKDVISQYITDGFRLLNLAEGGDEPLCSYETRSANAKKVNKAREDDPFKKRVHELKLAAINALRTGNVKESTKEKFRYAATKRPDLFGVLLKYL